MNLLVTGPINSGKTQYLIQVGLNETFVGNNVLFFTQHNIDPFLKETSLKITKLFNVVEHCRSIESILNFPLLPSADVIIIDDLDLMVDLISRNNEDGLHNLMYQRHTDFYASTTNRKFSDKPIGSMRFMTSMSRIIFLEANSDEIKVIKDLKNPVGTYAIR